MKKKLFLLLLMVAALTLSGCNLVEKNMDVDNALVILSHNGQNVTKKEVTDAASNYLYQQAEQYYYYGYNFDVTSAENIKEAQNYVVEKVFKPRLVLNEKVKELGLDQFTAEEEVKIAEEAQANFDSQRDLIKLYYFSDTTLEGEALDKAIDEMVIELGSTLEEFVEAEKETFSQEKLRNKIVEGIAVSDEEVEAKYNENVTADEEKYTADPSAFANALNNGTTVYYTPEGIRYTKHILRSFTEEAKTEIADIESKISSLETEVSTLEAQVAAFDASEEENQEGAEEAKTALNDKQKELADATAQLAQAKEKGYQALDETVQEVLTKLKDGGSFDELMEEYGEDPGMKSEPQKLTGYALCADYSYFDPAFVTAGMALEKIGDVSDPVKGSNGIHIIEYTADRQSGAVALDDELKETLHEELLTAKQNEHYNAEVETWLAGAKFTENLNNLNR